MKARHKAASPKVFLDTNLWLGLINPFDEWSQCARRLETVLRNAGLKPLIPYVVQGEAKGMLRREMRRWYLRLRDGKMEAYESTMRASNRGRLFMQLCREGYFGDAGLTLVRRDYPARDGSTDTGVLALELDKLVDRLIDTPRLDISVRFVAPSRIRPELKKLIETARELLLEKWHEAGIKEGSKHENDWRVLRDTLLSLSPGNNLFLTGDRPHARRLQRVLHDLDLEKPSQNLEVRLIRRSGRSKPGDCSSCRGEASEHWRCRDCETEAVWLEKYLD